jgi:hypothetical protein
MPRRVSTLKFNGNRKGLHKRRRFCLLLEGEEGEELPSYSKGKD